jgi:hypothetical protein
MKVLRSQRINPWANWLDEWLLIFVDGQDSPDLILTPIFLLAGVFSPLLLDFKIYSPNWTLKQRHFAGILSVGVGDSFAAIVGSKFVFNLWFLSCVSFMNSHLKIWPRQMAFWCTKKSKDDGGLVGNVYKSNIGCRTNFWLLLTQCRTNSCGSNFCIGRSPFTLL